MIINKKGTVMVGTPTHNGWVCADYHGSYVNSIVLAAQNGWEVASNIMSGNSLISFARALIAQDFWDSDCDSLMFIDSDLGWDPNGFVRVATSPLDVIGGAYPTKNPDSDTRFHIKLTEKVPKPNGKPIMVKTPAVASGFLKISRNAMKLMRDAYPELKGEYMGRFPYMLWDPMIVNGLTVGEDYAFCERWRRIQGEIYVDPDIDFKHVGIKIWEGNFLRDAIMKENQDGEHNDSVHGQRGRNGDGDEHRRSAIPNSHDNEFNPSY